MEKQRSECMSDRYDQQMVELALWMVTAGRSDEQRSSERERELLHTGVERVTDTAH